MKKLIVLVTALIACGAQTMTAQAASLELEKNPQQLRKNFYNFTVKDINGQDFDFKSLAGKKVMIVNTASKCGFTPQYKELEELYEKYKDKGFVIIGFPSNDFNKQEPGTDEDIKNFCKKNYGVTFPMMSKISVAGKYIHPIYQFLTSKELNGVMDSKVEWNFQKYLIDRKGKLVKVIESKQRPMSDEITTWLNED